jgi:hypothetical protein
LRAKAFDGVNEKRLTGQGSQALVAVPHTPRSTASEKDTEDWGG